MSGQNKKCEVCETSIPDDFVNLLCGNCYNNQVKEIEAKKKEEEEAKLAVTDVLPKIEAPTMPQEESKVVESTQPIPLPDSYNKNGITDPNYTENEEAADKNQVLTNFSQFTKTGHFIWHPTRDMYTWIKNQSMEMAKLHTQYPKYVWKPKIVDVGCGCGLGSNIMSQEADFVWGIDKNELSINFAKECFTREKNNIYYCPQVSFEKFDIVHDTREVMKFDYVVAIEIIEHINDYKAFLENLIKKFDKRDPRSPSYYFISTPNRANKHLNPDRPNNTFHVREWTSTEYYNVLSEFFSNVKFMNSKGEPCPVETNHTPLLAMCSGPKL